MKLEDLDNRDDLMVDLEELEKEMDSYLENVTKEELKNDLEKVGFEVKKIENVFSDLKVSLSNKKDGYVVVDANNYYNSNENIRELAS